MITIKDVEHVAKLARLEVVDFVNVMREDKVVYEQTKEELMKNAPEQENGFFKVPKIGG